MLLSRRTATAPALLLMCLLLSPSLGQEQTTVPKRCQALLNNWCNAQTSCVDQFSPSELPLVALLDLDDRNYDVAWRCYSPSSLDSTKSYYDSGNDYCAPEPELGELARACLRNVTLPVWLDGIPVNVSITGTFGLKSLGSPCSSVCNLQPDICTCQCFEGLNAGPAVQLDDETIVVAVQGIQEQGSCDCPTGVGYVLEDTVLVLFDDDTMARLTFEEGDQDVDVGEDVSVLFLIIQQLESAPWCNSVLTKESSEFVLVTPAPTTTTTTTTSTSTSSSSILTSLDSTSTSPTAGTSEPASTSDDIAPIIGGAVGGGCLAIIMLALVLCRRRANQRKAHPDMTAMMSLRYGPYSGSDGDQALKLNRIELTIGALVGAGAFGEVREGTYKGKRVAIKSIRDGARDEDFEDFKAEAMLMRDLHVIGEHPNIIRAIAFDLSFTPWLIVMEYMRMGNLLTLLRRADPTSEEYSVEMPISLMVNICRQCASGMAYLEKHKYLHRDVAARNVLVDKGFVCKLSDFGHARDVYNSHVYTKKSRTRVPYKWMAIEAIEKLQYTMASDVWSFGVLVWEVFSYGCMPYPTVDNASILKYLLEGHRLNQPEKCPDDVYQLLLQCWSENPENRPTFKGLEEKFQLFEQQFAPQKPASQANPYVDLLSKEEHDKLITQKQTAKADTTDSIVDAPLLTSESTPSAWDKLSAGDETLPRDQQKKPQQAGYLQVLSDAHHGERQDTET